MWELSFVELTRYHVAICLAYHCSFSRNQLQQFSQWEIQEPPLFQVFGHLLLKMVSVILHSETSDNTSPPNREMYDSYVPGLWAPPPRDGGRDFIQIVFLLRWDIRRPTTEGNIGLQKFKFQKSTMVVKTEWVQIPGLRLFLAYWALSPKRLIKMMPFIISSQHLLDCAPQMAPVQRRPRRNNDDRPDARSSKTFLDNWA